MPRPVRQPRAATWKEWEARLKRMGLSENAGASSCEIYEHENRGLFRVALADYENPARKQTSFHVRMRTALDAAHDAESQQYITVLGHIQTTPERFASLKRDYEEACFQITNENLVPVNGLVSFDVTRAEAAECKPSSRSKSTRQLAGRDPRRSEHFSIGCGSIECRPEKWVFTT